jgi:hypothetical protein
MRNRAVFQAFGIMMDSDGSFVSRTDEAVRRAPAWSELPPTQAGVAAALRRAFILPADETERQFEELLRKLA